MAVRAIVGKKDVIEIKGRMYDTIEISPSMETLDKFGKVINKGDHPQLKVWLSADEKKIPIKIRTSVGIISFDFELVPSPS
jgi:hypothetical protein